MQDFTKVSLELPWPFIILICGKTGSGKTERVISWIRNRDKLFDQRFDKILYVYNQPQQKLTDISREVPMLELCNDIYKVESKLDPKKRNWVIYDDFLTSMEEDRKTNLFIRHFVTVKAHHLNCCTTILIQNYTPNNFKSVILNLTHLIIYRNLRDIRPINNISSQVFGNSTFISECMKDQANDKFAFVCIDFSGSEELRCRNFFIESDQC